MEWLFLRQLGAFFISTLADCPFAKTLSKSEFVCLSTTFPDGAPKIIGKSSATYKGWKTRFLYVNLLVGVDDWTVPTYCNFVPQGTEVSSLKKEEEKIHTHHHRRRRRLLSSSKVHLAGAAIESIFPAG
ncbi:hypothetical protein ACLOJK_021311 [Asimina triloba]